MEITIVDRAHTLRGRLNERLTQAADLRCPEHGQAVSAVTIYGRENGWFDSVWTACCETLTRQASALVKERC